MSKIHLTQKITPFLWFNNNAEEAIKHYVSIFPNSSIHVLKRWEANSPFPPDSSKPGTIQTGIFTLNGVQFCAFDAGPLFKFNESISFFVTCKDQEELDYYWERLSEGGNESACGWLKDKFGVSWQIVPEFVAEKIASDDQRGVRNMMIEISRMSKLDLATLEKAFAS